MPRGRRGRRRLGGAPLLQPPARRRGAAATASCSTASATSSTSRPRRRGAASLPLVFQRYLRPGDYTLVLKVEDINRQGFFRERARAHRAAVDRGARRAPPRADDPDDGQRPHARRGQRRCSPRRDDAQARCRPSAGCSTGMQRFDTPDHRRPTSPASPSRSTASRCSPRSEPPYSVELDLGAPAAHPHAARHRLRRRRQASWPSDEMLINAGAHRFRVRLAEPQPGQRYSDSLRARRRGRGARGRARRAASSSTSTRRWWRRSTSRPTCSRSLLPAGRAARLRARRRLSARRQLDRGPGLRQRAARTGRGRRPVRRALHLGARPQRPAGRRARRRRTSRSPRTASSRRSPASSG